MSFASRSLLAETKCDIICTGSNAQMLSGELAKTISGRYIQFPVFSLSFNEFLEFHKLSNSNESLIEYLRLRRNAIFGSYRIGSGCGI